MDATAPVAALGEYPAALYSAVTGAHRRWLAARCAAVVAGRAPSERIEAACEESADWLRRELLAFLSTDVDLQRANPLQIIRQSTRPVARVLEAAGVAVPVRDEFEQRGMPEDPYGFGPVAWQDMGDEVHEAGITWGAWKAATVLTRRRDEGKL